MNHLRISVEPLGIFSSRITNLENVLLYTLKAHWWHFGSRLSLQKDGKELGSSLLVNKVIKSYYQIRVLDQVFTLKPRGVRAALSYNCDHILLEGVRECAVFKSQSREELQIESFQHGTVAQARLIKGVSSHWYLEFDQLPAIEELISIAVVCRRARLSYTHRT